jgi:hypothetical protein
MAIPYNDADGVTHSFEEEAGAGGATRPVHGLSAAIVAIFTAIKNAVEATVAVADAVVASKLDSVIGHVDGLEATLSSILTGVGTTLHGDLDSVESKLDTLHTDISPPTAGYYGQGTVGTTATQLASGASQALKLGVVLKNLHATQDLYVGYDSSVTNSNGYKLRPGEERAFPVSNRNIPHVYGSGASTTYSYFAV